MNKNLMPIIIGVGVLVLATAGYAMWKASNPSGVTVLNPGTTTTSNTAQAPQAGAPIVKTDSMAAPYTSTVVVKGTVNPNGAMTTYWYEYGETSALGSKTSGYLLGSGYTTIYTPSYITGLRSNTNYYFKLSASNFAGTVSGATYSFKTNTNPPPTGNAPTTSTDAADGVARTAANLHGKTNPNNSETTFWFEYGLSSQLGSVTSFQSAGNGNSSQSVSVSVSNLQPLTKYYFRLNAQNQFGTINGQILNFTTTGPSTATAPTVNTIGATSVTNSSAKINANIKPNGAITTYWFEYSKNSSLSNALSSTPEVSLGNDTLAVDTSANISGLSSNTKYYFRVTAKNQYGTIVGDIENFTTKR